MRRRFFNSSLLHPPSMTTERVLSVCFKHDPISSPTYVLALKGGEMTSVPYQGVSSGSIALSTCTNKTCCTGSNSRSAQVGLFQDDAADMLCGPCGLIMFQKANSWEAVRGR